MHVLLQRAFAGAALFALAGSAVVEAQANTVSNAPTVSLTATKASTLTVTPSVATATLASITDNSAANTFTPVSVTTDWNLTGGATVNLVGWFADPANALVNGGDAIPSSRVQGRVGASPYAAFTSGPVGTVGVAGASLTLFSQAVAVGNYLSSRTDQLDINLDLTGVTTVAGNYTGTLNLQAIVQ